MNRPGPDPAHRPSGDGASVPADAERADAGQHGGTTNDGEQRDAAKDGGHTTDDAKPDGGKRPGRRRGGRNRGGRSQRGQSQGGRQSDRIAHAPRPMSPEQVEARRTAVPVISYPEELPVAERRFEIAAAIASHQVVVVAGETGSGKTTQLPKICLELGRGVTGMIGHTQPRRLAARSVAERIASELDVEMGKQVGYQVRFTDEVSTTTLVKLMTDGILLAEIQRDPLLRRYDTIIVDEAHERSLNIDFLLGYLAQLLPRRPDLKLVITSATIDSERFAEHFGKAAGMGGPAPVVEVTGRTYPVDVRYRPLVPDTEDDDADPSHDDELRAGHGSG
ncbi:MAG: DEAD/DEAH box helicase, partial [Actinomycetales bacterium]